MLVIGDDEKRRQRAQTPGALGVAAAWARLRCCASSTMTRGIASIGAPCIRTHGARNATRGTFTMMRWTPPLGLDGI